MKAICIGFAAIFLMTVSATAENHRDCSRHYYSSGHHASIEGVNLDIEDNDLIFTPADKDEDGEVRITEEHQLYVNDRLIHLNREQEKLVGEYHDRMLELLESAKKIGLEGAKIGAEGAVLGVKAVAGVFKLLSPDYDTDDLEQEMEREASKIEAKASRLEDKADEIEDQADELEDIHDELIDQIPELADLGWFD
jgi:predicted glycosyltransferase